MGESGRGVATIATVLNVTRLYNSCCAASTLARALQLARDYAGRREAFGRRLLDHPLHAETLEWLATEHAGALHLTLRAAELMGREETGAASEEERALLRLLTPLTKALTGKQAVAGVSEALECFGGAGYVEDTGLPRLLRDAQVLPIWEGTTNVLALDFLRAIARSDGPRPARRLERVLFGVREPALAPAVERIRSAPGGSRAGTARARATTTSCRPEPADSRSDWRAPTPAPCSRRKRTGSSPATAPARRPPRPPLGGRALDGAGPRTSRLPRGALRAPDGFDRAANRSLGRIPDVGLHGRAPPRSATSRAPRLGRRLPRQESRRPDALFHDPFAERLAGKRGFRLVDRCRGPELDWPMVARTVQFDRLILERVGRDIDLVVNLAAGLDARPYRMALPPTCAGSRPTSGDHRVQDRCSPTSSRSRLERWALDLADGSARRELVARIAALGEHVLILTEGLLIYLARGGDGPARDLAHVGSFSLVGHGPRLPRTTPSGGQTWAGRSPRPARRSASHPPRGRSPSPRSARVRVRRVHVLRRRGDPSPAAAAPPLRLPAPAPPLEPEAGLVRHLPARAELREEPVARGSAGLPLDMGRVSARRRSWLWSCVQRSWLGKGPAMVHRSTAALLHLPRPTPAVRLLAAPDGTQTDSLKTTLPQASIRVGFVATDAATMIDFAGPWESSRAPWSQFGHSVDERGRSSCSPWARPIQSGSRAACVVSRTTARPRPAAGFVVVGAQRGSAGLGLAREIAGRTDS